MLGNTRVTLRTTLFSWLRESMTNPVSQAANASIAELIMIIAQNLKRERCFGGFIAPSSMK